MTSSHLVTWRRAVGAGAILGAIVVGFWVLMFALAVDVGSGGGLREHVKAILVSGLVHFVVATVCWCAFVSRRARPTSFMGIGVAVCIAPVISLIIFLSTDSGMVFFPKGFIPMHRGVLNPAMWAPAINAVLGGVLASRERRREEPTNGRASGSEKSAHQASAAKAR